jgi:hypothetical protein
MAKNDGNTAKKTEHPLIKTDKEFRELFHPQTTEENAILEQDILDNGCHTALVVWKEKGILVDGYHRYDICKKHNVKYRIHKLPFKTREEVKLWMWNNQAGRRNVSTPFQRIEVALKIKAIIAAKAKERQIAAGKKLSKIFDKPAHTYKILGEMVGVSHVTVRNAEFILKKFAEGTISFEEIDTLRQGKAKINRIYRQYHESKSPVSESNAKGAKRPHVAWKDMTQEDKHVFIRDTLDKSMKNARDGNDKLEFARLVIEWATRILSTTSKPQIEKNT